MCALCIWVFLGFFLSVCEIGEHQFPEVGLMKKPFMEKSSSWGDGMREGRGGSVLCVCVYMSVYNACVCMCGGGGVWCMTSLSQTLIKISPRRPTSCQCSGLFLFHSLSLCGDRGMWVGIRRSMLWPAWVSSCQPHTQLFSDLNFRWSQHQSLPSPAEPVFLHTAPPVWFWQVYPLCAHIHTNKYTNFQTHMFFNSCTPYLACVTWNMKRQTW